MMARKELSAQAANIKRAVETTATCTTATVDSLKSYLMLAQVPLPQNKTVLTGVRGPTPKGSQARAKHAPWSKFEKRLEVTGLEGSLDKKSISQLEEKIRLATEVANVTLKALTEAIKSPPPKENGPRKSPSKSSITNVLQPICANIASKMLEEARQSRCSFSAFSTSYLQGLRSQAESARVAFAALRSMHARSPAGNGTPSVQLESGMSALIGKLIALGFDDLALKELRILKTRLDQSLASLSANEETEQIQPQKPVEGKQTSRQGETLSGLLKFQVSNASSPLLALIVASQLQALKLIALKSSCHGVEAAVKHLQLCIPYSPANLIDRQIDSSSDSRTKAARHLELLAQSINALGANRSTSKDKENSGSSRSLSPHATLSVQTLALEVRLRSWKISGHRADILKELIQPFVRNLGSFRRLCTLPPKEKYQLAKTAFQSIFTDPELVKIPTSTSIEYPSRANSILDLYQLLADLAQECSSYEDAVQWLQSSTKLLSGSPVSSPRLCASFCRIASVRLRALINDTDDGRLLHSLFDAAESLQGDIKGEWAELEDLLLAVTSLRRSAFSIIQDHQKSLDKNNPEKDSEILDICSKLISLGVKFLIRFLGRTPGPRTDEKAVFRHEQQRTLVWNNAGPFFESVAAMARFSVASSKDDWERLDAALHECTKLAATLIDFEPHEISGSTDQGLKELNLVPLSNAYWYRYKNLKQNGGSDQQIRKALFLSTDILKNRPHSEKMAGGLPLKLERSGVVHEASKEFVNAAKLYAEALQLQMAGGLLRLAADDAATRPLSEVLGEKSDQCLLGRLLLAYPRVTLQIDGQTSELEPIFDDGGLSAGERGLLLEQQLAALISTLHIQSLSSTISGVLQSLTRKIFTVYTESEFPIRRLRVSIRLLRIHLTNSLAVEPEIMKQILSSTAPTLDPEHLNSDAGLCNFASHLLSTRALCVNLRAENIDVEGLEGLLASWSSMLRNCSDSASLQNQVDEISEWTLQLQSLADYLEMHGLGLHRVPVLHILIMAYEIMTPIEPSIIVSLYSALGLQYVRLGYSSQAGHILHKALRYPVDSEISWQATLRWNLVSAEYALGLGDVIKADEHLASAREIFKSETELGKSRASTSKDRIQLALMLAEANYASSLIAVAKGKFTEAFLFARQNVRLNYHAWGKLERQHGELNIWDCAEISESDSVTGSQPLPSASTTSVTHQAAKFWNLVPRLFHSLVHLSQLYANEGLLQESRYYLKQAQRTAEGVNASRLKVQSLALLGNCLTRCGETETGLGLLQQAEETTIGVHKDHYMASLYIFLAESYALQKDIDSEAHALESAERTLKHLMKMSFVESLNPESKLEPSLEMMMDQMNLPEAVPARRGQTKKRVPSKAPRKASVNRPAEAKALGPSQDTSDITDASLLAQMRCTSLRQRAYAALRGNKLDLVASLLSEAGEIPCMPQDRIHLAILKGHLYLRRAQESMAADPVFCVLPESTVSHPSIAYCRSRQEKDTSEQCTRDKHGASPSRKVPAKRSLRKPNQGPRSSRSDFLELLSQTQESLISSCNIAKTTCSTATMHTMMDVLTKTLMMLSAVTLSRPIATADSTFAAYSMELGRTLSSVRQNLPVRAERQLSDRQDWPTESISEERETSDAINHLDFSMFQTQYIDIIPPCWTVLSLSLSESQNEIRVARMRSDQTPFILTLPLNRHNSREPDDHFFGFQSGKEELQEIIELARYSSQESKFKDISKKAATEWWEVRQALDTRLKDLLVNIENLWLGGFRGIFSHCTPSPALLSLFHQSLQKILDKHLPSRQRPEKKKTSNRTFLDQRVLELFVGLGVPTDVQDLDEPLMDLLYFVIDILQFHGERNAYDEIDFDAIAVELIDALRQYHDAAEIKVHEIQNKHTILILDKALHAFPWESLPCMEGHAISRLPSLGCLRDRIMQQDGLQRHDGDPPSQNGLCVPRKNGAWILNPSGDLTASQARLEQPLRSLSGWTTIVQRAPSEDEMKTCLENKEIFLYFGHGSGSQYIRARTVRKLEKCAVTILMGCSSGALTEAREFEPYGTPMNFMQAGCPALLANLWDVTDKDIDLFTCTALEKWGLLSDHHTTKRAENSSPMKRVGRPRGGNSSKVTTDLEVDNGLSLDQALAQARDSCRLRYLNGAAPVVYGVPVFLC